MAAGTEALQRGKESERIKAMVGSHCSKIFTETGRKL